MLFARRTPRRSSRTLSPIHKDSIHRHHPAPGPRHVQKRRCTAPLALHSFPRLRMALTAQLERVLLVGDARTVALFQFFVDEVVPQSVSVTTEELGHSRPNADTRAIPTGTRSTTMPRGRRPVLSERTQPPNAPVFRWSCRQQIMNLAPCQRAANHGMRSVLTCTWPRTVAWRTCGRTAGAHSEKALVGPRAYAERRFTKTSWRCQW
mmetsp:Transcript_13449/g.36953  ORF Transcript_13449/g.36953 Transcript_13449/m.36953 type:complete len:207 (+) Transcript_13449:136-756(+)